MRVVPERPVYLVAEDLKPLAEARSDEQGRFRVPVDEAGTASLSLLAWAPGYRLGRFALERSHLARTVGLRLSPGISVQVAVRDGGGKPVAGAVAGPLLPAAAAGSRAGDKAVPQWSVSDAGGSFAFEGVDAATEHTFLLRAPGCQMAQVTIPAGQRSLSVTVTPGGWPVSGQVVAAGAPDTLFGGVPVRLTGNSLQVVVSSDGRGAFALDGVPSGDYTLEALPRDGRASRAASISLPEGAGSTWTLEVSSGYSISGIALDAESGLPIPSLPVVVKLREEGPLQEVISAGDGTFTAGPFFLAWTPTIETFPESGYRTLASLGEAPADIPPADGFQSLSGIEVKARRSRQVLVKLENFQETTVPVALTLLGAGAPGGRILQKTAASTASMELHSGGEYHVYGVSGSLATPILPLQVGEGPEVAAELKLEPAARLNGRLLMRTEDGGTTPARSFSVSVLVPGPGAPGGPPGAWPVGSPEGQADLRRRLISQSPSLAPDGSYSFPALPAGIVQVLAGHRSNSRSQARQVRLVPGETATVDFLFEPGGILEGTVVDGTGQPVAGAGVDVSLTGGMLGELKRITLRTNAHGRFQAEDLEGETAERISVNQHGYFPQVLGPIALPASSLRIELKKRGFLRATVTAAPDTVWDVYCMAAVPWKTGAYPEQLMSWTGSVAKGVRGGVPCDLTIHREGRYRVVAIGSAKELAVSLPFAWAAADSTDREVQVAPGQTGTLTGSYPGGESVQVTAWNTSLPEEATRRVEFRQNATGGTFNFGKLPPGDYLLTAEGEGGTASATNVEVVPGGTAGVTLETETGVSPVHGMVRSGETGVANVELELVSRTDSSLPPRRTRSGPGGKFTFDDVPADEYLLQAALSSGGATLKARRVVLVTRRGAPDPVLISFSAGKAVTILPVQLADLDILPGAQVIFNDRETGEKVEVEWVNGNEKARARLEAGDYDIYVGPIPMGRAAVSEDGSVVMTPDGGTR